MVVVGRTLQSKTMLEGHLKHIVTKKSFVSTVKSRGMNAPKIKLS